MYADTQSKCQKALNILELEKQVTRKPCGCQEQNLSHLTRAPNTLNP